VGSRSKKINTENFAYIAGFLDGDGSLMLQLKKRSDTKSGIRFMATICFYQDTRHSDSLVWFRTILGVGYLSNRKDGMTELRVNGFDSVQKILTLLRPFIKFKSVQTDALLEACNILKNNKISSLNKRKLKKLVDLMFVIKKENYASHGILTKKDVLKRLGLTP